IFSFFFSSRRRHTSFSRDWSSDVCSSDLTSSKGLFLPDAQRTLRQNHLLPKTPQTLQTGNIPKPKIFGFHHCTVRCRFQYFQTRSEERRVGKECRSWWEEDHQVREE